MASPGEWSNEWPLVNAARDRLDTLIEASATAASGYHPRPDLYRWHRIGRNAAHRTGVS
jgi:hypothetical protein